MVLIRAFLLGFMCSGFGLLASDWRAKVDPDLLSRAAVGPEECLIVLADRVDLSPAQALVGKTAKGRYVFERLNDHAKQSQADVLAELRSLDLEHESFWIANMIWVKADEDIIANLAQRSSVARIIANTKRKADLGEHLAAKPTPRKGGLGWPLIQTGAAEVWDLGIRGAGVVIGAQDTGYDWDHPALMNQYLGWNGMVVDHNYHWHDSISTNGGICGPSSPEPCDDNGHGTHTLGSVLGSDGVSETVGMAPDARWIGCRNMDRGNGTPVSYSECFQWFLAPTDLAGNGPDPDRAPHIIVNSWGCPSREGCIDPFILNQVVDNVRAAGILVVASAGNSGSNCESVATPPALYEASFSVAATNSSDDVAGFSSRGPARNANGSLIMKPDIAAPGVSIRSSTLGGGYGLKSGTSMAAPHVAGLAALLISAQPSLAGNVDRLEMIIRNTALRLFSTQDCMPWSGSQAPNPVFGHGRIRALVAVRELLGLTQTLDCSEWPGLLVTWGHSYQGFPDRDGDELLSILDILKLGLCP